MAVLASGGLVVQQVVGGGDWSLQDKEKIGNGLDQ